MPFENGEIVQSGMHKQLVEQKRILSRMVECTGAILCVVKRRMYNLGSRQVNTCLFLILA